ncbi:MAG: adenylyl-sulfate kinase [Bacteroidetes bacterium]|nr:adenylyl-sulfate kinase [Bacteroidota bacterium]
MKINREYIWTDFNSFIRRNRKRFLIKQNPKVIWLTGLSGAGKTTVALALEKEIQRKGYFTKVFDGDIIRKGINKDLGYSIDNRMENIRRISEVTKLFLDSGLIIICSFISPTEEIREMAKSIIGKRNFIEVYVNSPFDVCEKRDPKGLYAKARKGLIKNFTGIDSIYEAPIDPDIELKTDIWTERETVKYLLDKIMKQIKFKNIIWPRTT